MSWKDEIEREERVQKQFQEWAKRQQELGEIEDAKAFLKSADLSLDKQEQILRNARGGCSAVIIAALGGISALVATAHQALGSLL